MVFRRGCPEDTPPELEHRGCSPNTHPLCRSPDPAALLPRHPPPCQTDFWICVCHKETTVKSSSTLQVAAAPDCHWPDSCQETYLRQFFTLETWAARACRQCSLVPASTSQQKPSFQGEYITPHHWASSDSSNTLTFVPCESCIQKVLHPRE